MVRCTGLPLSFGHIGNTGLNAKFHHGWEPNAFTSQLQDLQFDPELNLMSG